MRRGRRITSAHLVLHFQTRPAADVARAGFVVGKVVGNSVARHRVIRQLRHIVADALPVIPADVDLVVRALTGAHGADLRAELGGLLERAGFHA